MAEAILFASSFALVFLLGLQQLNVHARRYGLAGITSLLIGATNIAALKLVPEAGTGEILAYLLGGPLGILASMYLHDTLAARAQGVNKRAPGASFDTPRGG